jgi:hypothetical protein
LGSGLNLGPVLAELELGLELVEPSRALELEPAALELENWEAAQGLALEHWEVGTEGKFDSALRAAEAFPRPAPFPKSYPVVNPAMKGSSMYSSGHCQCRSRSGLVLKIDHLPPLNCSITAALSQMLLVASIASLAHRQLHCTWQQ